MTTNANVAILFTDLVGSTELSSSQSPDEASASRQTHFGILRRAVVGSEGKEVKTLGDGIMAVFPTPSSAVAAAVEVQRRMTDHNRRSAVQLHVRIGISAGEVTVDEGDYFGDPVIEASRLCASASSGEILVGGVVRTITRGKGARYGEMRDLSLKGIAEPVPACPILWDPTPPTGSLPLPWRTEILPTAGVVGRVIEQAKLLEAAKAVAYGDDRRVVLVTGEAGVGKTTLIAGAARAAHGEGMTVLYGACDEEIVVPYRPFIEALDHFASHAPDDWMKRLDGHRLSQLARLVPEFDRRRPDLPAPRVSEPDAERYLLFSAVAEFLTEASSSEPLVLILDDLHWADRPTLHMLLHLLSVPVGRVLIVCTYRDVELSGADPLTEALGTILRAPAVESLPLSGFELDEVVTLLEVLTGGELDEEGKSLAHSVWRSTEGNPFFVSELLRNLSETGSVFQDETGRWRASATANEHALPETVRAVVRARAARLAHDVSAVLAAAAVLGRTFDLGVLAALSGTDVDTVLDNLELAQRVALVSEVPDMPEQFRFRHALVQQTFYEELNMTRRRSLHRRAADIIEAASDPTGDERAAEIAQHLLEAGRSADPDRTIDACRRAGDQALSMLAPDEAVRWYRQAISNAEQSGRDRDDVMAGLLVTLGDAKRQAGDATFRDTLLDAAHRAQKAGPGAAAVLVAAALANSRGFASGSGLVDPERLEVLDAALRSVGTDDSADRAQLLAVQAAELTYAGEDELRLEVADEARSIARRLRDPAALLRVLNMTFHTSWTVHTSSQRLADTEEAEKLAAELRDPGAAFWSALWRAFMALEFADPEETSLQLNRVRALADEVGQPTLRWLSMFPNAMWALIRGSCEEAESLATDALQLGNDTGQPDTLAIFGSQLMSLRWHQGRLDEVVDMIAEVAASNPGIPAFRSALAFCQVESGRAPEARALLERELASGFEHPNDLLFGAHLMYWSEVASHLHDAPAAHVLLPLVRPHASRVEHNGTTCRGSYAHAAGILAATVGDLDSAEDHLGNALRVHDRLGAPFLAARTMLELAKVLRGRRRAGDGGRAEALLAEALDLAVREGCALVAERAKALCDGEEQGL